MRESFDRWPYRLRADEAAEFCSYSRTAFDQKVSKGEFPKPAWVEGNRAWWRKADLIDAMEADTLKPSSVNPLDGFAA